MRVYLDTNLVSAIAKQDFPEAEMQALRRLQELSSTGKIDLLTSEVARREIQAYQGEDRKTVDIVYLILAKVPMIEDHRLLGFNAQWDQWGGITYPLVEDHPLSSSLRAMGLDRTDAHHLMLAIDAKCEVFLTLDGRTILNRRAEVEVTFPTIRLMRPAELAAELHKNQGETKVG